MEESKNNNEDIFNELLPCYENSITFDNPEPLFKCHFMKKFLFYKITFHIRNYTESVWKKGWILKSEINKEKSITTTSHILSNDIEKDDILSFYLIIPGELNFFEKGKEYKGALGFYDEKNKQSISNNSDFVFDFKIKII